MTAVGNPATITYSWYSGRLLDEFVAGGALLTLETVTRHEAGSYVCVASNSEGSTTLPVILDVLCTNISLLVFRFSSSRIIPQVPASLYKTEIIMLQNVWQSKLNFMLKSISSSRTRSKLNVFIFVTTTTTTNNNTQQRRLFTVVSINIVS